MYYLSIFGGVSIAYLFYFGSKNTEVMHSAIQQFLENVGYFVSGGYNQSLYTGTIYNTSSPVPSFKRPSSNRIDHDNMPVESKFDKYKVPQEFKWCHCW